MRTRWAYAVRTSLLLSGGLAMAPDAAALQVIDAVEGQTVLAKISARELTRITIDRARVRAVTGLEGQLLVEKDDHTGAIFVRPVDQARPVNLFVSTDAGRTYALVLQPVDMPAETIVLRDRSVRPAEHASALERSGSHEKMIKSMVLALANGDLATEHELREAGREIALWREAHFFHERSYVGRTVVGDRYRLTNISAAPMRLAEAELYKPGVLAVAIERLNLAPGETTNVFIVRQRGANE
jgi:conjugal transfer pilus assembly protein TraK